ncbi:MAG: Gfo/Idh/MocA family oxidoreductase [Gemmataceae bacterium]
MIRVGIVDCDTSHVVEFTKRFNHIGIAETQWVDGVTIVAAVPGTSQISPERIKPYVEELKKYKVEIVEKPADLIGKIDAVMIESVDGSVHLERAEPFLKTGMPCYIDKPFACKRADAVAMVELANKHKTPVFSSSSLRYAPELQKYLADAKHGPINSAMAYGPASEHPRNPGLFHYGIHAAEILFTLMGPGCQSVTAVRTEEFDEAVGTWKGGRIGTVRGIRTGASGFGAVSFAKSAITHFDLPTTYIYRELLKQVAEFFKTRKAPIEIGTTVEIVSYIEAAAKSVANHSMPVELKH